MTNRVVDHEAFQAAQALCMLALDARMQSTNGDETEDDDCVITHARPVVHRYHPYRRPEPQQAPPTIQQPITSHRDNTSVRPTRIQRPSPLRQILPAPPPTPDLQPTFARHHPVEEQPTTIQQPTTDGQPSPMQSPSHTAAEDVAHTADQYSFSALILQALLAAPQGEWWSRRNVADWLEEEYPQFLEQQANRTLRRYVGQALNRNVEMLERCAAVKGVKHTQYRLLARARETATRLAWKPKQPPFPKQSELKFQGEPLVRTPYAWKSLALQALLAAPQGQRMQAREVINYLATQYPQFLGCSRNYLFNAVNLALNRTGVIVERSSQFGQGRHVFWRIAPGARDEATRLAWTASTTRREPE